MNHPFALELSDLEAVDLDFEENLTDEAAAEVAGGILPGGCVVTGAYYEGGGYGWPPIVKDPVYPVRPKYPPYEVTTLALGEEGGHF
ncbi:MAG TPA: hypothetical protein DCE56_02910 [Cyanobacteria bacterium UBA8553]|nr:hypothetical protein [Cyanobacteria bacterium UBA8553]HAJ63555.1 hypothetical protein [Cyanobacteria bacterium UBA8543]